MKLMYGLLAFSPILGALAWLIPKARRKIENSLFEASQELLPCLVHRLCKDYVVIITLIDCYELEEYHSLWLLAQE